MKTRKEKKQMRRGREESIRSEAKARFGRKQWMKYSTSEVQ